RINRNVPPDGGGWRDAIVGRVGDALGCHRPVEAHIRSRLTADRRGGILISVADLHLAPDG
ncbi:MAG: hypothetical protein ABEH40_05320, partial [Haloferacaceae archaeon]